MIVRLILLVAFAAAVRSDPFADKFMDNVLFDMRGLVPRYHLDPALVTPFQIVVEKEHIFQNTFYANFTRGSLVGLSTVSRAGNCTYGPWRSGTWKLGCYVTVPVQFQMNADVQGDTYDNKPHRISSTSTAQKTYALIEVEGMRGAVAGLSGINVTSVTLTFKVIDGKLDLNQKRQETFVALTHHYLANQLVALLHGDYSRALLYALSRWPLP